MTTHEDQPAPGLRTAPQERAAGAGQPQGPPVGAVSGLPLPQGDGAERQLLEQWLDFQRATLAAKCAGLGDEQLRTASAPPSGLTLLGLVRHLTKVERHWFRTVFGEADSEPLYSSKDAPDGDFAVADAESGARTLAVWRQEVDRARRSAAARSLDDTGTSPWRPAWTNSLRWIHLHVIGEYARHNGHADLLRERIDGRTGF
ncbi:DinB family protein [Streptomyces qinglanensis]|uniref:DinB family protein n=1 Tax=Streptomyces TaxID=1883 RepID=UPI000AA6F979|nr:DinB family protein [Streptomyces qinglanensis]